MASWIKDKYDPDYLASSMEATRSVNKKGQASFSGWEHREHIVLLDSLISFRDGIPDFERSRIIKKAVFSSGSKGVITPKRLLSEISRIEAEFLRRTTKKYYLITSISMMSSSSIKRYVLDRCSIVFKPSLPNAFIKSRDRLTESAGLLSSNRLTSAYMFVRAAISARSEAEAADVAIDAIDMLRGI